MVRSVNLFLVCAFAMLVAGQRAGSSIKDRGGHRIQPAPQAGEDLREIQRQNTITAQILENFLERRLYPNKRPTHRLPTLDEILPKVPRAVTTRPPPQTQRPFDVVNVTQDSELEDDQYGDGGSSEESDDYRDPESLQSVESEHVDSYLDNLVDYRNEDCPNCIDDSQIASRWTMPLLKLGEKRYYLGVFFKANWYKAAQYCRFHGMHLASISSQEENDNLEKHIKDFGLGNEHFWTSGTDLADEGNFFWMANGRPITFTNWNAGEPNNFRYENGEEENCMELWNRDGKGLKWNDSPCSFETFFVCEV